MTRKLCELVAEPFGTDTVIAPVFAPDGTVAVTWVALVDVITAETLPPNRTDVIPESPVPVIATDEPTGPDVGEIELIVGAAATVVTVKLPELVPVPPAVVTAIGPLVAPAGTVAVSCVSEPTANDEAAAPLNATEVAPVNPVPVTVTEVPAGPDAGEKPLTVGAEATAPEQPGSWNDPIRVCQSSPAFVVGCAS